MLAVSGALWGRKKKKGRQAGRRRPPAVMEPHESWWSGRSCWGRWLLPQHRGNALCKLSTPGPSGEHCGGDEALRVSSKAAWFVSWEIISGQPCSRCYWHPLLNWFVLKAHVQNPVQVPGLPLLPPLPPVHVFTWCLWFVLHHLPPTPSSGIEKATHILPTAETCRDFHHFALVGSQDTPWWQWWREAGWMNHYPAVFEWDLRRVRVDKQGEQYLQTLRPSAWHFSAFSCPRTRSVVLLMIVYLQTC